MKFKARSMTFAVTLFAFAFAFAFALVPAWAEVVIIAHPANAAKGVSADVLTSVYTGKSNEFTPVEQLKDSPARKEFHEKFTKKTEGQLQATWARIEFSGKGLSPRQQASDADVKKAVAADPAAIGYINKAAADASVKILPVNP